MKAILVIDMPNNCYECPCYKKGQTRYECSAYLFNSNRILIIDDLSNKPNDCPLKPMPQRKMVGKIKEVDDFMKSEIEIINEEVTAKMMLDTELLIASGYNLCIDEILGDTE